MYFCLQVEFDAHHQGRVLQLAVWADGALQEVAWVAVLEKNTFQLGASLVDSPTALLALPDRLGSGRFAMGPPCCLAAWFWPW